MANEGMERPESGSAHAAEHAAVEHRHVEEHAALSSRHLAAHESLYARHREEHASLAERHVTDHERATGAVARRVAVCARHAGQHLGMEIGHARTKSTFAHPGKRE